MAIASSDILYKHSTTAGAAGDTTAGTPAASLGKYVSTTQITAATLDNLFDDVAGAENAASEAEYRLFFVHNNHASITWTNVVVWLSSETAGGASAAISVDTTGVTNKGSATAQAKTIANEDTAPASQTFSSPTTKGTGLAVGNIGPGQVAGIWVRRTAGNTVALANDGVVIRVEGDTTA